ncbi:hypothetical protein GGG16DRAFT_66160 [Schizophyllum commune]
MEADGKQFKKATQPFQEVNRPTVTDHNIHEDFVRNPPNNEPIEFTHTKTRGLKEGAKEPEPYEPGVTGHEGIGRPKHADVEGEAVQEGSIHPQNPSSHGTHEADGAVGQLEHGGGHRPPEGASTKPNFAASNDQSRYTSSDVDYETKYAPDPYGEELSKNARVWSVYNDEAEIADKERLTSWISAGLFSAVVTTFVAQSSQALTPDYAQITASLVYKLVLLQRAAASGNTGQVPESLLSLDSRTQQTSDIWVNKLWLISLMFSLLTALVSVLAKQWIQASCSLLSTAPRDRALVRNIAFWDSSAGRCLRFLPVLLTIALFFFFAGLAVYVAPMDTALYTVIVSLSGISIVGYAGSVTFTMIYPQCAYRTPVSDYIATTWFWLRIFLFVVPAATISTSPSFAKGIPKFAYTHVDECVSYRRRESFEVNLRRTNLMMDVLDWLARSSFNNSAESISAQALSALNVFPNMDALWIFNHLDFPRDALLEASLRDCGTSRTQVIPLAGRIERLMRDLEYAYSETTCQWLNERWDSLHGCHDENILPLRMLTYAAALKENQEYRLSDHTVLQRAVCAVDHETWPSGLLLHLGVWRHLCYAMRQYENVVRRVSALKPYAEPSPSHEDDGYEFLGRDYYEKTAISLDAYAQRCQAGTGRDDILSCMLLILSKK